MELRTLKTGLAIVSLFLGMSSFGCGSSTPSGTAGNGSGGSVGTGGTKSGTGGTTAGTGGTASATGGSAGGTSGGLLTAAQFSQKYKFTANAITGWKLDPADPKGFLVLDENAPTNLVSYMDGGADAYTNQGCRLTLVQSLVGPDPDSVATLISYDFDTAANATAMFTGQVESIGPTDSISGYDASVAMANGGISGLQVYAHFNETYFELQVGGYGDQSSTCSSCSIAAKFLDWLKSKSN